MKKAFSLLFISVVLLSGMTLRYSEHYCQGILVAAKLSLAGDIAGCSMSREGSESSHAELACLRCVNEIVLLRFSDNYIYSSGTRESGKQLPDTGLPLIITPKVNPEPAYKPELRRPPPGVLSPLKSECEVLCVFRRIK